MSDFEPNGYITPEDVMRDAGFMQPEPRFDLHASALVPEPAFVAKGARLKIVTDGGRETIVRVEGSRTEGRTLILSVVHEDDDWPGMAHL